MPRWSTHCETRGPATSIDVLVVCVAVGGRCVSDFVWSAGKDSREPKRATAAAAPTTTTTTAKTTTTPPPAATTTTTTATATTTTTIFYWTLSERALLIAGELYLPWHQTVQETSEGELRVGRRRGVMNRSPLPACVELRQRSETPSALSFRACETTSDTLSMSHRVRYS